jgi:cysteine desulfurase/selenocysteine lyase
MMNDCAMPLSPLSSNPWRSDFPILSQMMNGKKLAFLDSGASAQKPRIVIDAMTHLYETGYANIHRGLYTLSADLTARYENVRSKVAAFIGARTPESIVFTHNATEGFNLIAYAYARRHLKQGDEVIITEMEHHANIVPWQLLADTHGVVIRVWPITDQGTLDIRDLTPLMNDRTRIVSFAHVSNVLGTVNDIHAITTHVKAFCDDIIVVIDGAQGIVHAPVDVSKTLCDFYVFTGHKIYGPSGVGILYGNPSVMDRMGPWQGGGDMIETVSFSGTTYRKAPHLFEAGTPAIADVIGLGAALDYVSGIGMDRIADHEKNISAALHQALLTVPGIKIYGAAMDRAGIYAFCIDGMDPSDIAVILNQCGVAVRSGHHCAMPLMEKLGIAGTVRASIALYTDESDIQSLIAGLLKAREMLR